MKKLNSIECKNGYRITMCKHCGMPIVIGPESLYIEGYSGRALEARFNLQYIYGSSINYFVKNAVFDLLKDNDKYVQHICNNENKEQCKSLKEKNHVIYLRNRRKHRERKKAVKKLIAEQLRKKQLKERNKLKQSKKVVIKIKRPRK